VIKARSSYSAEAWGAAYIRTNVCCVAIKARSDRALGQPMGGAVCGGFP
jgi:hypothetical protein